MNVQFMEDSVATTREGRVEHGRIFPFLLLLMLGACAPLPPEPDKAAESEASVAKVELKENASSDQGDARSGEDLSKQVDAGSDLLRVPHEQQAQVATVNSKSLLPKPAVSQPATSKQRVSSKASSKTASKTASKVSSSAKVAAKSGQGPAAVKRPEKVVVAQSTSSLRKGATATASTRQESFAPSGLGIEPDIRPVTKGETFVPPIMDEYIAGEPVFQGPLYGEHKPLELPPIKSTVKKRPATSKHKPRLPVKIDRVTVGGSQIEMVQLRGGTFQMGSNDGDYDERPLHKVSLRPFSIGRYEVTQRQWKDVMGDNPSYFDDCADCPVDSVSWIDIQHFITKLNQLTAKQFRLPSEAEWEYACRSGDDEAYCGGSDETQVSWYLENSGGRSQPVGRLASNAFGLHDMSGNAYEWVEDCWHGGYGEAPTNGQAWSDGDCQRRVLRGGAWYYASKYSAATYRNANLPYSRFIIYGFRLAHDR